MIFFPPEYYLFFGLQLPATILLGLISGVVAVHLILVRRGRISLRANGVVILIAALELAVIAPNPAVTTTLVPVFALAVAAMALVDAAIRLEFDRGQPSPRFSPRLRRRAWVAIPLGLLAWSQATAAFVKYKIFFNPDAASWLVITTMLLGMLAVPTVLDLVLRALIAWLQRRRRTTPARLSSGKLNGSGSDQLGNGRGGDDDV